MPINCMEPPRALTAAGAWRGQPPMISVSLCDPQPIVHEGLKAVLASSEQFELAHAGWSLEEASAQLGRQSTGIVIVDRAFGMHSVLEWIGDTRRAFADTEVVLWAGVISDVERFRGLQAGARGVLRKTAPTSALFHCLETVARRELWTEDLFTSPDSPLGRPRTRPLTPREQEVASLVAKGMKNREIAEALNIATGTVKIHLMHIFEKTGIRDRFELALHGLRLACDRAEEAPQRAGEPSSVFQPVAPVSGRRGGKG